MIMHVHGLLQFATDSSYPISFLLPYILLILHCNNNNNKQPEEIRSTFNITNDFSPEEEAQVREENKWCEEA